MFKLIAKALSTNQLTRNISAMVSGNAMARAIGVLALPVITRLYSPADFGALAVFVSFLGLLLPFVTLRYSVAVPLPKRDGVAANLIALCLSLTVASTLVAIALLGLFALSDGPSPMTGVVQYWWAIAIALMGTGLYESLGAWAVRKGDLAPIARTMVYQSIGSAGGKVLFGLVGMSPLGLILGHVIGSATGALGLAKELGRDLLSYLDRISMVRIIMVSKRYLEFPKFRLPSQFLLAVSAQTPILFSAWIFGDGMTGQLSLALVIVGLPITLLGKAIGQSLYAEIASLGADQASEIRKLCMTILRQMALLMLVPMAILLVWGPSIFAFAFGEEWRPAGEFTRILSVYMAAQLCALPLMNVFNVLGGQFMYLAINAVRVLLIFSIFSLAVVFDLSDENTVTLFSALLSVYSILLIYLVFHRVGERLD